MLMALTGYSMLRVKPGRRYRSFVWLGEACARHGIPLLVVSPERFRQGRGVAKSIVGDKFKSGVLTDHAGSHWSRQTVRFSDVSLAVYDAMYLADLKQHKVAYARARNIIKEAGTPIFNPALPSKSIVCQRLEHAGGRRKVVPLTKYHVTIHDVFHALDELPSIWLKPIYGSGGRNMVWIRKVHHDGYEVHGQRFFERTIKEIMPRSELAKLFRYARARRAYLVQEHIPLVHTEDGRKVDFRVTVQRDHKGVWQPIAITARTGAKGSPLTNFHAGGSVLSCTNASERSSALLAELGMTDADVQTATKLALKSAKILQMGFPMLGLLGIDVGQSTSGEQYVYDCNSRPGRDILTDAEIHTSMNLVAGYASYVLATSATL